MTKNTLNKNFSLPVDLYGHLKPGNDVYSMARLMPAGQTYNASTFVGHLGQLAHHLWFRSPVVSPLSHHLVYVDERGTMWFRWLQVLIPRTPRELFPCQVAMKDEKKRYYRMRAGDSPHPRNQRSERRVRDRWLVSQTSLWALSEGQLKSLLESTTVGDDCLLGNREELFSITRRTPDACRVDSNGVTSKTVDIPYKTDGPVLREMVAGLDDYAQRLGSAETLHEHDRAEFPIPFPMRNMAIDVILDDRFVAAADLELEWRNQEMARFRGEGKQQEHYEILKTRLGRHPPRTDETDRPCSAMVDLQRRLKSLRDSEDDRGNRAVTSRDGEKAIARLTDAERLPGVAPPDGVTPLKYSEFLFIEPYPPLGQVLCVKWKMPDEDRGYTRSSEVD